VPTTAEDLFQSEMQKSSLESAKVSMKDTKLTTSPLSGASSSTNAKEGEKNASIAAAGCHIYYDNNAYTLVPLHTPGLAPFGTPSLLPRVLYDFLFAFLSLLFWISFCMCRRTPDLAFDRNINFA
jgi:hypothetical protein